MTKDYLYINPKQSNPEPSNPGALILNVVLSAQQRHFCPDEFPSQIGGVIQVGEGGRLGFFKDFDAEFLCRSARIYNRVGTLDFDVAGQGFTRFGVAG